MMSFQGVKGLTLNLKTHPFIHILSLCQITVCLLTMGPVFVHASESLKPLSKTNSCIEGQGRLVMSAAYSPYSVHVIRSEVNGRIIRINGTEGQILKAGIPLIEIDSQALREQLVQLQQVLANLQKMERVLSSDLELSRKKYRRYLALKKTGHVEEQAVENIEREFHSSELALIGNKRQQAETRRNMIELEDKIKKCAPSFSKDLYVAENFKELFETVVPGEKISRLLDISRAKLHLVLPPACFSLMEEALKGATLSFEIVTEDGKVYSSLGRVEKLKVDPDNDYLYSYGFDLVFKPIKGLLWGQVVKVHLGAEKKAQIFSQGTSDSVSKEINR